MTTESELETETETDRESVVDRCVMWCAWALNDAAIQPNPTDEQNMRAIVNILKLMFFFVFVF